MKFLFTVNKQMQITINNNAGVSAVRGTLSTAGGHISGYTPAGNQSGDTYTHIYNLQLSNPTSADTQSVLRSSPASGGTCPSLSGIHAANSFPDGFTRHSLQTTH